MLEISREELEVLPKALHDRWMEEKLRQGWTYGPVKDAEKKTHPDLIPYEDLPEDKKELDRMYIRDFLKILDNAGFVLQEGQTHELSKEDIEELAKASHELWLEKASPDHEYYKPYEELPEPAKELNRKVEEWNFEPDHIHVFRTRPSTCLAKFINAYKSASSRLIKKEFPELKKELWDEYFWSRSYCLLTSGGAPIELIRQYIQSQGKSHVESIQV